jgi:hypothetical protein
MQIRSISLLIAVVTAGAALLACTPVQAANGTSGWSTVAGFHGHYECVKTHDRDTKAPANAPAGWRDWSHEELSATADFDLELPADFDPDNSSREYLTTRSLVQGTYHAESDNQFFGGERTRSDQTGSFSAPAADIKLTIDPRGKWSFSALGRLAQDYDVVHTQNAHLRHDNHYVDTSDSETHQSNTYADADIHGVLPAKAGPLVGSDVHEETYDTWSVSRRNCRVVLTPYGESDLVLEVESPAYNNWRPSASVANDGSAGPGTAIEFTATLKRKSGKPAGVAIDKIVWELIDTSKEPGIAINYPNLPPGVSDGFDLRFEPLPRQVGTGPDLQQVSSEVVDNGPDRARIVPLDWGGWSVLKVAAYVHDGPVVIGRYKGSSDDDVRLPKRSADSFIADAWKRDSGAKGAENADEDDAPMGDGVNGDGLTLYEEYRGWYERGAHRSGDPKVKDYFVYNEAGETGRDGMRVLQSKSGLAVHELLATEFDLDSRIINRNGSRGPHVVDQHGVWLKFDFANAAGEGISEAYGGPGTPGKISHIGLTPQLWRINIQYGSQEGASITAHELLHAVNVLHHGEEDRRNVTWSVSLGFLFQNIGPQESDTKGYKGTNILVFEESGLDVTQRWINLIGEGHSYHVWLGMPHGEHSGFEDCIMRYDVADAYPATGHVNDRLYIPYAQENIGMNICTTQDGVGFNATSHAPQSRYFSASPKRGNCASQIRVTDRDTTSQ